MMAAILPYTPFFLDILRMNYVHISIRYMGSRKEIKMVNKLPIRQPSLADQVYEIIMKGISDGTYPQGSLLPSENQYAERVRVSQPTIRSAFARLEERGYIKRQRGGTYVTESHGIVNPLYQLLDVPNELQPGVFRLGTSSWRLRSLSLTNRPRRSSLSNLTAWN